MTMPGQRLGAPERKGLAGFESAPTECLLPGAANSVKAACSWNLSLRSKPSSVVGVANNADMQAAFRLAAARDLPVGVDRAGRGAVAPIDDVVLVSTQQLETSAIDPANRKEILGAGAKGSETHRTASPYGIVDQSGSSSDVAVTGYTVRGGMPDALERWSTGRTAICLHGVIGDEADRARVREDETYRRLVALMQESDPDGRSHFGRVVGRSENPQSA